MALRNRLGLALRSRLENALPGKAWQIRSIGPPPPYYDPLGAPGDPEAVHPLLSQPLIEVCLRIPTPTLVSGGWDRAIARRAFMQDIPPEIARRRGKGASTASAQRLFEANLPFLRDLLLDGALVRKGLLDRDELERPMSPGGSLRGTAFVPILLQHMATEAWLRRWTRPV
jgi:asparagine synthase (glutamine-hydrolysing)